MKSEPILVLPGSLQFDKPVADCHHDRMDPFLYPEFVQNVFYVGIDRIGADPENSRDFPGALSVREPDQNFLFPARKRKIGLPDAACLPHRLHADVPFPHNAFRSGSRIG